MGNSSDSPLTELARQLVSGERARAKVESKGLGEFPVCEQLRVPLLRMFGVGGYRPLVRRALGIATQNVPWLSQLLVTEDGGLEGFAELPPELDPARMAEGEFALVTELLGLLVTFIGWRLTASVLQDVWPNGPTMSFQDEAL